MSEKKRKRSSGYYARIMGTFWRHPRTRSLSLCARGLWVSLLSWCADQRSDGLIDATGLAMVTTGHKDARAALAELLSSGLVETVSGNYVIRNWSDHNTTREEHDSYKSKKAEGMSRLRGSSVAAPVTGNRPTTEREHGGNPHVHVLLSSERETEQVSITREPTPESVELSAYEHLLRVVRSALYDHAKRARDMEPPLALSTGDSREVGEVARWVRAEATRSGESIESVAARLAEGWATSRGRDGKWTPLLWLARNPGEYLPTKRAAVELPADLHDAERLVLSRSAEGRGWPSTSKLERVWVGLVERHPALMAGRRHPGHTDAEVQA